MPRKLSWISTTASVHQQHEEHEETVEPLSDILPRLLARYGITPTLPFEDEAFEHDAAMMDDAETEDGVLV